MSVVNQTLLPDKLVVFDDNDAPLDMRENQIYQYIFSMLDLKGIAWEWVFSGKIGQHHNHQIANKMGYDFVWRMDDDTVAEADVLKTLYYHMSDSVGAVGGSILTPPLWNVGEPTGKIENLDTEQNIQWGYIKGAKSVDHLHCSFLYRAGIHDYNLNLSRIAHREETMFTYGLKQKGYEILVVPCITWHLKNKSGGIRGTSELPFILDEEIFRSDDATVVVLDCGMGDHIVAKKVLRDIKNPIVFSCFPEIVPGRSIAEAIEIYGNIDRFSIYRKMDEWSWSESLENAFKKLYGVLQ
jgi:hypothetical protein